MPRYSNDGSCHSTGSKASGVRFAPYQDIRIVPTIRELSQDESEAIWYDADAYTYFVEQCEVCIRNMENGIRLNETKYSSSGLEAWTKDGFRRRRQNRLDALDIVLDEQFAQWGDGEEDVETISELYQARTENAKMVAVTRGLALEREVQADMAQSETLEEYLSNFNSSISTLQSGSFFMAPSRQSSLGSSKSVRSTKSKSSTTSSLSGKSKSSTSTTRSTKPTKSKKKSSKTSKKRTSKLTERPMFSSPRPAKKKSKQGGRRPNPCAAE